MRGREGEEGVDVRSVGLEEAVAVGGDVPGSDCGHPGGFYGWGVEVG